MVRTRRVVCSVSQQGTPADMASTFLTARAAAMCVAAGLLMGLSMPAAAQPAHGLVHARRSTACSTSQSCQRGNRTSGGSGSHSASN